MHEIQVLIGTAKAIETAHQLLGGPRPQVLRDDLRILALPAGTVSRHLGYPGFAWPDLEALDEASAAGRLEAVGRAIGDLRLPGTVAVVLTQHWGGDGTQAGVVVMDGSVTYGPWLGAGAVNAVLRVLGVKPLPTGGDEWDAVGLGRWRSMDAFEVGQAS